MTFLGRDLPFLLLVGDVEDEVVLDEELEDESELEDELLETRVLVRFLLELGLIAEDEPLLVGVDGGPGGVFLTILRTESSQ